MEEMKKSYITLQSPDKLHETLALIKDQENTTSTFLYTQKAKGDLEKIFQSPTDNCSPKCILIEGAPGIGKTTLCKEIALKWARGELLTSCRLLLLLSLRDPDAQKISTVQDFAEHFTESDDEASTLQTYLENKGTITIILDGVDDQIWKSYFFAKLIKGQCLPNATIVMTSQPPVSACLHDVADLIVDIVGFHQSSRKWYINEALIKFPLVLEKFKNYLKQKPHIDALCYNPSVMSIVIYICLHQSDDLPSTASEIHEKFVKLKIYEYLKSQKMVPNYKTNTIEQFSLPVLQKLAKFAFIKLLDDKIVFTSEEITDECMDNFTCCGLLQCVEHKGTKSYSFVHLSIQEYLAAIYMAGLPKEEIHKQSFFKKIQQSIRFPEVWSLYCSLTTEKDLTQNLKLTEYSLPACDRALHLQKSTAFSEENLGLQKTLGYPIEKFYSFKCFQEVKDDMLCEVLSKSFSNKIIDLKNYKLSIQEIDMLGLFLTSKANWTELNLFNCKIGDKGVIVLHRYLCRDSDKMLEISTINLMENDLTEVAVPFISDIISFCHPHTAKLGCNILRGITSLLIGTSGLKILNLYSCDIAVQEALTISDMMASLEELNISSNNISDKGAIVISTGIFNTSTLRVLYLNDNNIGPEGTVAIAEALSENTSLLTLNMTNNVLCQDGAVAIADALMKNNTLEELFLYGDHTLSEESAILLLKKLYYGNNTIVKLGLLKKFSCNNCIDNYTESINKRRKLDSKEDLKFQFY